MIYDQESGVLSAAGIAQYQWGIVYKPFPWTALELPNIRLSSPFTEVHDNRKFKSIFGTGVIIFF